MLEFYAKPLFDAAHALTMMQIRISDAAAQLAARQQPLKPPDDPNAPAPAPPLIRLGPGDYERAFKRTFDEFRNNIRILGLQLTEKSMDRLVEGLVNGRSGSEMQVLFAELRSRFADEVEVVKLLCIPKEVSQYYEPKEPLFGNEVFNLFPSASDDIAEAGKCLALSRATASVFHLMRTTEVGLKAVARELGIPYAPSWESYIKQIQKQIQEDWSQKTPDWKTREPLFRDILGDLQAMKLAWRNPTMHIVKKYSEDEAFNIWGATKSFMARLATNKIGE